MVKTLFSQPELVPCPFCPKGEPEVVIPEGHYFRFYQVICSGCGCRTKEYPDKNMAVEHWNRREGKNERE